MKVEEISISSSGGGGGVGREVRMGVLVTQECVVEPIGGSLKRVLMMVVMMGLLRLGVRRGVAGGKLVRQNVTERRRIRQRLILVVMVREVKRKVLREVIVIRHGRKGDGGKKKELFCEMGQ